MAVTPVVRMTCLLLAALACGMAMSQVLQIPAADNPAVPFWLTVEQMLYREFGRAVAVIECGALALCALLVWLSRRHRRDLGLAFAAALCVAAGLGLWVVFAEPATGLLSLWAPDSAPAEWQSYRDAWLAYHGARALLFFIALAALVAGVKLEAARSSSGTHVASFGSRSPHAASANDPWLRKRRRS
jgi:hypothetical protein